MLILSFLTIYLSGTTGEIHQNGQNVMPLVKADLFAMLEAAGVMIGKFYVHIEIEITNKQKK